MVFAYLSCLIVIMVTLFPSEVVFAVENPKDTTRNTTLKGDPNCVNGGTIYTWTNYGYGMHAKDEGNYASNFGTVRRPGFSALGMYVRNRAIATNSGSISTGMKGGSNYGEGAHGMYASYAANIDNKGEIITYGVNALGMYGNGAKVTNSGIITVTGTNADAVYLSGNNFVNSGTLDSLNGEAVTAINSTVTFHDGTRLVNSHGVVGDSNSTLTVNMNEGLVVIVRGFGTLNKDGKGIMMLEGGSSADDMRNNAGTLKIAPDTTFETTTYIQTKDASLHFYVPTNPNVGPPLSVAGDATFAGNVIIDFSNRPLPGKYVYIYIGGEKIGDFDSVSFVNPGRIYVEEKPEWKKENSWHYTNGVFGSDQDGDGNDGNYDGDKDNDYTDTNNADNGSESAENRDGINKDPDGIADTAKGGSEMGHIYVDYAFSEQALGLVSTIEDWSLLRWIMANHLQDVASEIDNLEAGKKVYYAHFLANKTDRDPAGRSPLGYESGTKGLSFGFGKKTDEKTVWGIYAGYTEKDIGFTDVVPASSDWEEQDSWHIGAYICKRYDKWIISDTLTYRTTGHDSFRRQKDGDARASFDSWAITNGIRAGYVVKEIGENSNWEIVPEIGINVGHFDRGGYTETNGYTYGGYDTARYRRCNRREV
ncbi:autotransporter outer membrane beta-barrel domain-containing protein [Acetomicrobium sp.]|uniref:autotransporter outer membrane beta-barrel domain-containing protein n=1 Tax=Acetomicrobium sp. TaxID=1872099 RepID=UPI002FC900A6